MEITNAKLIEKYDTATFGANGFRKREFVVEYAENPQYPEFIKFELIQDNCVKLDPFNIGAQMEIKFNLKGRPFDSATKGKQYFNSLQAWSIKPVSSPSGGQGEAPNIDAAPTKEDMENLPFILTILLTSILTMI